MTEVKLDNHSKTLYNGSMMNEEGGSDPKGSGQSQQRGHPSVRGEGRRRRNTVAKKFEEMDENEKRQAFEKWVSGRTARRGTSTIRRKVTAQLIAAHQAEYNKLLVAAGGKVKEA